MLTTILFVKTNIPAIQEPGSLKSGLAFKVSGDKDQIWCSNIHQSGENTNKRTLKSGSKVEENATLIDIRGADSICRKVCAFFFFFFNGCNWSKTPITLHTTTLRSI